MIKWIKGLFKSAEVSSGLYVHIKGEKLSRYVVSFEDNSYDYMLVNPYGRLHNKKKKTGSIDHLMNEYCLSNDKWNIKCFMQ